MQKQSKMKLALRITLVMTVVSVVLRVLLVPGVQDAAGPFRLTYLAVAIMALALIGVLVLVILGRREMAELPAVKGRWLLPIAALMMLVGVCVLVSSAVDLYNWTAYGIAPPPTKAVISGVDRLLLFATLIFGVLAGIYLIRLGLSWFRGNEEQRGTMKIWALMPTAWIWMRLARYEISYSSAVYIYEGFYDFAMLLLMLLFLFALARLQASVGKAGPARTAFFALGTALMALSGPLTRVVFYLLGEGDAYRAGQLAGIADFAVGLLAAALAAYWIVNARPVQPDDPSQELFSADEE